MATDIEMEVDQPSTSLFVSKKKKGTVNTILPWVEKYRPKKVDEVVYQEEVVSVLKKCLTGGDFPHLLFYGPPGTGKTSTILALALEMFGSQFIKERVLELNSSDERGIDVIRQKVKTFSSAKVGNKLPDGTRCPAFKIVILDEADSMTNQAQSALRRIIESSTETTRFCIICNYITRIITPIASRCTKFRFKPLTRNLILNKLKDIATQENMTVESEDAYNEIINVSDGDMRKAITFLHSVYRMKAKINTSGDKTVTSAHVTIDDILEVSGFIPSNIFDIIIKSVVSKSLDAVERSASSLVFNGFSSTQFLLQLHDWVLKAEDMTWQQKCPLLKKIASADACLLEGASEYLQLLSVLTTFLQVLKDPSGKSLKEDYRCQS